MSGDNLRNPPTFRVDVGLASLSHDDRAFVRSSIWRMVREDRARTFGDAIAQAIEDASSRLRASFEAPGFVSADDPAAMDAVYWLQSASRLARLLGRPAVADLLTEIKESWRRAEEDSDDDNELAVERRRAFEVIERQASEGPKR